MKKAKKKMVKNRCWFGCKICVEIPYNVVVAAWLLLWERGKINWQSEEASMPKRRNAKILNEFEEQQGNILEMGRKK